jgi:hypothetical protein
VRRALLVSVWLGLALVAAGCGSTTAEPGSGGAPAPADLAGDATQALFDAGSAHYELDGSFAAEGEQADGFPSPITVHFEGDFSQETYTGDGTIGWPGGTFNAGFLLGQHDFFLNFLGRWFGTKEYGLAKLEEELERNDPKSAQLYRDLQTGDGVRRYFDRVFTGEVGEGPETDGAATWVFEGHLNADGIMELVREYGGESPSGDELEAFRRVAEAVRITLLVGQDDRLPRRMDVSVQFDAEDFEGLDDLKGVGADGSFEFAFAFVLSDFGKDVSYEPPANFEPLEKAVEGFFSSWG